MKMIDQFGHPMDQPCDCIYRPNYRHRALFVLGCIGYVVYAWLVAGWG